MNILAIAALGHKAGMIKEKGTPHSKAYGAVCLQLWQTRRKGHFR
jgi:hypothetical protein